MKTDTGARQALLNGIVMAVKTPITAEQLLKFHGSDRCELVAGELRRMSPAGWKHGMVVHQLAVILGGYIEQHRLGLAFGAETGFLLARDPDTVRAPDLAFIARANLPAAEPTEAFWPGAPDLAVEVLSPDDRNRAVAEKTQAWLAAGCKLVWIVDPALRIVTVYRSVSDVSVKDTTDELDGDDVVPGFHCKVADIFTALR